MTKPTWIYTWGETAEGENNIATVLNRLDSDGYDVFKLEQEPGGHTYDIIAKLRTNPPHNSPEQKEYFLKLAAEVLAESGDSGRRAVEAVSHLVRYLRILKT